MRRALIIIPALLLAACGSGPQWENEQDELANEANGIEPAAVDANNLAADTDYINETAPAANDANAAAPTMNEETPPE